MIFFSYFFHCFIGGAKEDSPTSFFQVFHTLLFSANEEVVCNPPGSDSLLLMCKDVPFPPLPPKSGAACGGLFPLSDRPKSWRGPPLYTLKTLLLDRPCDFQQFLTFFFLPALFMESCSLRPRVFALAPLQAIYFSDPMQKGDLLRSFYCLIAAARGSRRPPPFPR